MVKVRTKIRLNEQEGVDWEDLIHSWKSRAKDRDNSENRPGSMKDPWRHTQ